MSESVSMRWTGVVTARSSIVHADGCLMVSKLVPWCSETAHVVAATEPSP